MAKQTFTTGQVLTAAQLTSLQQTAMSGGAASAKTSSYTLVAADAGTAISMTSTSATTITVNTGLFAAGDTVQITNLDTGVCTITAGTATVNTSASLALAQYESGTLSFTSASAAIFIKGAGAAAASGGMTLINTGGTTLTGASVTLSSIPQTYINLYLIIVGAVQAADGYDGCGVQINGDTALNRHLRSGAYGSSVVAFNDIEWKLVNAQDNSTSTSLFTLLIPSYTNTTSWKIGKGISVGKETNTPTSATIRDITFVYNQTAAVSSLVLSAQGSTFSSGTAYLYGVK